MNRCQSGNQDDNYKVNYKRIKLSGFKFENHICVEYILTTILYL